MSPRRPPAGSRLPKAGAYAVTTYCRSLSGKPQRTLRRRQRDVHDGGIRDDHELSDSDDHQDQPAPVSGRKPGGLQLRATWQKR
jgi:hypothetical protein